MTTEYEATSARFAECARVIGMTSRSLGLRAPAFRAPPRDGLDRSVRHLDKGNAIVAVRLRGRSWSEVVKDMVEGTLAANRLAPGDDLYDDYLDTFLRAVE